MQEKVVGQYDRRDIWQDFETSSRNVLFMAVAVHAMAIAAQFYQSHGVRWSLCRRAEVALGGGHLQNNAHMTELTLRYLQR